MNVDYSYRDSWLSPLTPVKTREDHLDEMPCVLKSEDEWNLEGTKLAEVGVASNVMERKGGVERLDRWASDLSLTQKNEGSFCTKTLDF